ncbi:AraC family transcriptional regulator [Capnocytophaga sp. G2]|uniref:helix-turn-helix domain-containing protein n=1 Tax=Capnocytophaga sp. G2 TaxID=3110695 RepID=UPI002B499BCD|nr:AraC family transcriptional regulator [Capnocytophaga sp. G2]MEB3005494.1 AraC family transcriptional regulator [Capnocytophaga sp. G2]
MKVIKEQVPQGGNTKIEIPIMRTEADIDKYYGYMKNKAGEFVIDAKLIGEYNYYSWRAQVKDDYTFEGKMAIPSVRFYFLIRSRRGVYVEVGKAMNNYARAGAHNVFFCKEECLGKDRFFKEDNVEVISIAISEAQFAEMACKYPETFINIYQKFQKEGNFFLRSEQCFVTSFQMMNVLQQLKNSHLLGKGAKVYADLKMLELFLLQFQEEIADHSYQYCKTHSDIDKIHEVSDRIISDLQHTPSISELAREVGLNEKKLCYGFKEVFGNTIFGYLYDYKMHLAQQLLLYTEKSISEVALQCGYEYLSHFSTAFKRKYGITPQGMRETITNKSLLRK